MYLTKGSIKYFHGHVLRSLIDPETLDATLYGMRYLHDSIFVIIRLSKTTGTYRKKSMKYFFNL